MATKSRCMTLRGFSALRFPSLPTIEPALNLLWTEADRTAKHHMIVTLFLVLGAAAVTGFIPLLVKVIIDELERTGDGTSSLTPAYLVATYAFAHWLSRSLGELRSMTFGRADQRMQRGLSCKVFRHVMALPLRFHLDRKTGALGQILTNGLLGYRIVLQHFMLTVLPVVVELGAMFGVLLFLGHAVFMVIICASMLFYIFAFWIGITRIGKPARAASNAHIDAYAVLTDSVLNYETVKYFGGEKQARSRFVKAVTESECQWAELFTRKMENGLAIAAIFALSLGISVYVAAREVQQETMTIGEFVLVNAYIIQITRPLEMIGFALRDIAQGMAFIDKMIELLGQEREAEGDGRITLRASPPDLGFERVSYSYHADRYILKDVSFVVPSGKTVAVVGASGSGKSSLIRLLLRMVEPTAGKISLNGSPLSEISLPALRNSIAVVPQDIALFNDSIAFNIAFGNQDSTEADIVSAAKVAHIHDFIAGLPDGYETKVGERGLKLSGGEKQRVAIARAAIRKPKVFVFDEATSSLDSEMERAILDDLSKVAEMTTTLIIAHRLSTVVNAHEIVMLDHGIIVDRGTHDALLRDCRAYAAMWRAQHGRVEPLEKFAFTV